MAGVWLYDSKAHAAALSEGRHRRCNRYAGFSRGRAAQPRISRARECLAESRPKSAATMLRSMTASSAKGYLACPSAGLATVFRGAIHCSKLARAMRLPEQQQGPLSSGPQEWFRWWQFRSCKPLGSLAVLCSDLGGRSRSVGQETNLLTTGRRLSNSRGQSGHEAI